MCCLFEDIIQTFNFHQDGTPKRQLVFADSVAQQASGWALGPIFGSKINFFTLHPQHPFFGALTDKTQWDHISPIS